MVQNLKKASNTVLCSFCYVPGFSGYYNLFIQEVGNICKVCNILFTRAQRCFRLPVMLETVSSLEISSAPDISDVQ